VSSFEHNLREHRIRVNQKLKEFNNTVISISSNNIDKITRDADVSITWRNQVISWELREQQVMEEWLSESLNIIENKYSKLVEDLRTHQLEVLYQRDKLELHRQKLCHLKKVSAKKQRLMRERPAKVQSSTTTSTKLDARGPGSTGAISGTITNFPLCMEDFYIAHNSMRLGTRIVDSAKVALVSKEESVAMLSQMLCEVTPDSILTKRLQYYISHYSKLSNASNKYPPKL
jgi:hypothetical protein